MSYDATSEPNEFVGDSRDEAISKATSFFGVEESDLRVSDLEDVFNAGARTVLVAVPKNVTPRKPRPRDDDRGRDDRGGRGGRERGGRDRGGREGGGREGGGRDRGDRGGRGDRGPRGGRAERDDGGDRGRDREREPAAAAAAEPAAAAAVGPVESKGTASGDTSEVGNYVLGIVERMRLGDFQLTETEEDDFIVVQLEGPAADRLGEQDRAVGALQLLVNQAAMQSDEDPKRVVVDCDSDAEQRESFLERTAGRAAKRATETGRSVALDPMNGRDRRALHVAVRPIEGVVTMSVGTGRYRQVVIVPEAAPEYAEAEAASREVEDRD